MPFKQMLYLPLVELKFTRKQTEVSSRICSLVQMFYKIAKSLKISKIVKRSSFLKGATKLYFIHYSHMVSTLLSAGLQKSVISTCYFGKTMFSSFVFQYLWLLIFSFALCFELNVSLKDLITLYNQGI